MKTVTANPTAQDYADLKAEALRCLSLIRQCESAIMTLKNDLDANQIPLKPDEGETEEEFLIRVAEYINDREHEIRRSEDAEFIRSYMPSDAQPETKSWIARKLTKLAQIVG